MRLPSLFLLFVLLLLEFAGALAILFIVVLSSLMHLPVFGSR